MNTLAWFAPFAHPRALRKAFRFLMLLAASACLMFLLTASNPGPVQAAADPFTLSWSSIESDWTESVAWGDYDGDGDLDLAVGNWYQNQLYRNDNGMLTASAVWSSVEADETTSVAWGDYDGDGDLDLAVGNGNYFGGQPNRLYRNDGGMLTFSAVWSSVETDETTSVAWGDYDGDGDLDLAVGNGCQISAPYTCYPNRLYRNDGGVLTPSAVWSSVEADETTSVAWGDYDGDGDLDLAVGNGEHYDPNCSCVIAEPNRLYRNDGGVLTTSAVWSSIESGPTTSVAWGDYDGDGDLDLAVGNSAYYDSGCDCLVYKPNRLYRNTRDARLLPGSVPSVRIGRPGPNADFYSASQIWSGPILPLPYTLFDHSGLPARRVIGQYSLNGGGQWLPAVAASGTVTTNLYTPDTIGPASSALNHKIYLPLVLQVRPFSHIYYWDVAQSGVMGQSDNVVFRLIAIPAITNTANGIPGPYLYGSYASSTFPFRVRGTQVRVLSEGMPVPNAVVYRLPAGQSVGSLPYTSLAGQPFRTDSQGYLQGRGQLNIGDRLVALLPITSTDSYTLYYTSAAPTLTGLNLYTATTSGVQTLTVSSANPLILFNLDVSLEWDASKDTQYLEQLQFNLRRASELLYDATNGQAALGNLRVFFDKQNWDNAHLRLYANNRLRPFASQGGVVSEPITDSVTSTVVYLPGQVHMAATWNRYGNPGVTLGEDWPRTLAHELGHYLFFQDDDYLGLDASGRLIAVTSCTGTLMSDPYRDDYSELKRTAEWLPGCASTLANKSTGRSDWGTVTTFYSWLTATTNTGPSGLPLAVTQVQFVAPVTATTALDDPRFYLTYNSGSVQPGKSARAFLFKPNALIDLGGPVVDQVLARGAQPGDRVCVFEPEAGRQGCKTIAVNDNQQLSLSAVANWQPDVTITPITTQTVSVQVANVPTAGPVLIARLYATTGLISGDQSLSLVANAYYSGTFTFAGPVPVLGGYVHVWVASDPDPENPRAIVTEFALGGNPANQRSGFANQRSGFANQRSGFAPVLSGDGQVILYTTNLDFPEGTFYAIQAATNLPNVPAWATAVGKGYRVSASAGAPSLSGASLSVSYAESDVPPGGEPWLRVYSYTVSGGWQALPSTVDADTNSVVAVLPGPGLYALMTAIEIPLRNAGWNLIAYPVQGTRTVTEALLSISDYYTTVYSYEPEDTVNGPWKVFDKTAAPYVNDLMNLEFGRGYWINARQAITWYLSPSAQAIGDLGVPPSPPDTYYGLVLAGENFTPTVGMPVEARVDNHLCGTGQTQAYEGQIVYVVDVEADDGAMHTGCGQTGRVITFYVNGQPMAPTGTWDNNQLNSLNLSAVSAADQEVNSLRISDVMRRKKGLLLALGKHQSNATNPSNIVVLGVNLS